MRIADYVALLKLSTAKADKSLKAFDKRVKKSGSGLDALGTELSSKLTKGAAIGAVGVGLFALTKNAAALESALAGIQKTTNFTEEGMQSLKETILDLGTEIPVPTAKLLEIAQVAGTLDLAKGGPEAIAKFTETFAQLEIASDRTVAGELGAKQFARFITLTGETVQSAENVASAFTQLGNSSKLNEGELLRTAGEVAGVAAAFNLSANEILGLSTAYTELIVRPEAARTASLKFFQTFERAALSGKGMKELSAITGETAESLRALQKGDSVKILTLLAKGYGEIRKAGGEAADLTDELKVLGLNDAQVIDTLLKLSLNYGRVTEKVKESTKAYKENVALGKEVELLTGTFNSEIIKLKSSFVSLGNALASSGFIGFLAKAISLFKDLILLVSKGIPDFFNLELFGEDPLGLKRVFSGDARPAKTRKRRPSIRRGTQPSNEPPVSKRAIRLLANGSSINNTTTSADKNVQVSNNITINSNNPMQVAKEVSRVVSQDVALAVGS